MLPSRRHAKGRGTAAAKRRPSPASAARGKSGREEGAEEPRARGRRHQAGRAAGLGLCSARHGAARGAQSVALIPPCPARSQIPFTSMSAWSVRPAPGETARGDGGEDLLKRHCFEGEI